ncbi:hypothetical protein ES703_44172 [subsurface metagenome]
MLGGAESNSRFMFNLFPFFTVEGAETCRV